MKDTPESVARIVAEMREDCDRSDECQYGTISTRLAREWADRLEALTPTPQAAPADMVTVPRALIEAVLKRDSLDGDCRCIRYNRKSEQEYESGTCPHQRLRTLLAAPGSPATGNVAAGCNHVWLPGDAGTVYCDTCRRQKPAASPRPAEAQAAPGGEEIEALREFFAAFMANNATGESARRLTAARERVEALYPHPARSEAAPVGDGGTDTEAARRYIRDWCPDHVKDYIASLAAPLPAQVDEGMGADVDHGPGNAYRSAE